MLTRMNYRALTPTQRDAFVGALYKVKAEGVVDNFAAIHASHFSHGIHSTSHFLPWHREFILRFEERLRRHDETVTLPYWDSTTDVSPQDPLWDAAFLGQFNGAWRLRRNLGGATLPTAARVDATLALDDYPDFRPRLEVDIHNPPHRWVGFGSVMASAASPGDPVFYLHHCWVDLLWVRWRLKHPDSPYEGTGAGDGIDDPLSNWPDRTPADVIDHLALGYQYDVESLVA